MLLGIMLYPQLGSSCRTELPQLPAGSPCSLCHGHIRLWSPRVIQHVVITFTDDFISVSLPPVALGLDCIRCPAPLQTSTPPHSYRLPAYPGQFGGLVIQTSVRRTGRINEENLLS
ncbi:hypothetical protein J6590_051056 [Homalodisca vitripennis]|nr:hypothetical protein J6590_051056 [Homalodisca vitripennis]